MVTWLADFLGVGYVRAIAAAVVVALIAWSGWTVNGWRQDSNALEATETALETRTAEAEQCAAREQIAAEAYAEAAGKAAAQAEADRIAARRIECELSDRIATAESRRRDLARRLLDATRAGCPSDGAVSGSASVAGAVSDRGEPGGVGEAGRLAEAIRGATADAFAACARDGEALSQVGPWYDEVRENRGEIR